MQHKNPSGPQLIASGALDRLTLALVDRLPTEAEKEQLRILGSKGAFEVANRLIGSREFFDRLAFYWQSQLKQTPAWLWEKHAEPALFLTPPSEDASRDKVIWFAKARVNPGETVCAGIWTLLDAAGNPQSCACDETVDVLPSWDPTASMRVCPSVKSASACGENLQHCVPADARFDPKNRNLGVDLESAGGRAITRLISDVAMTQGRAFALSIVTKQKWSRLATTPIRTVQSRSSIELIRKWTQLNANGPQIALSSALQIGSFAQPLKNILHESRPILGMRRGVRPMADSPAEELFVSAELETRTMFQPLRSSGLEQKIWDWNTRILLTCQMPHLAPQIFPLPLPHPVKAKEGSYFCSSCHLEIDKQSSVTKKQTATADNSAIAQTRPFDANQLKQCAVEHAIHFLLGYRPSGSANVTLKRIGSQSYLTNSESVAAIIRDLALDLMTRDKQ